MIAFLYIIALLILGMIFAYFYRRVLSFKKRYKYFVRENNRLREENKKIKRLAKIKSEFIAMTVHQLRTPLAKIKWILYAFINGDFGSLDKKQKDVLEGAYHANEKMVLLLKDLLDISKTEDVGLGYHFDKGSIETVAEGLIKSFSLAARQKKIDLVLEKPKERIPEIMMDSRKISLALGNLIDNALKYTGEGGRVEISLENLEDCVKISVKDNGIGIPEDEKEKIFTQFFRAKNAESSVEDGTGLGLYIVKNIVKIHGGKIWFESKEGEGTVFSFTIPFRGEDEIKKDVEKFIENM